MSDPRCLKLLTEDFLKEELFVKHKMLKDIAKEYKVAKSTLWKYTKKFGIKVPLPKYRTPENIVGKKIDMITVKSIFLKNNSYICKCICDCGNEKDIYKSQLTKHGRKSCGCIKREGLLCYEEITKKFWSKTIKRFSLDADLTIEEVWNIYLSQNKKCALTGLDISFVRVDDKQTASLDRIDSKKGYTKNNIQIVHKVVNYCKHILSNEEFIAFCNLVSATHYRTLKECLRIIYDEDLLSRWNFVKSYQ